MIFALIHIFWCRSSQNVVLTCTFFVSFLAIKKSHKESTKEKKEKTCNCLGQPAAGRYVINL